VTLTRRIIACLDVDQGRVVKGVRFEGLRDAGDPVERACRYQEDGADEIVFLDISATVEGRRTLLDVVRRTAERLFIPLAVGGGIASVDDMAAALRAGADKVCVNSAIATRPGLLTEAAARFGAQCVVASIDARREGDAWRVRTRGGRAETRLDAVEWARRGAVLGAGEVLLTSIDRDGGREGYDLALTAAVAAAVDVPVVASGGGASAAHMAAALAAGADAALIAGVLHDGVTTIAAIKAELAAMGVAIRPVMEGTRV
jgi:imidazole glycerol-phosphate synthase subunit HisF